MVMSLGLVYLLEVFTKNSEVVQKGLLMLQIFSFVLLVLKRIHHLLHFQI